MPLLTLQRALLAALALVCVASDWFLAQQRLLKDWALLRHLVDSGAHGLVGFCAWGVFLCRAESPQSLSRRFLARCVCAGVTASLLDVDHFIAAGAFSIAGATHLKVRAQRMSNVSDINTVWKLELTIPHTRASSTARSATQ